MKINKWLVVAGLAVMLIGGAYGGLAYVESRVAAAVREAVGMMDDASVASVRFTLPGRKLVITGAAATLYKDSPFACTVKLEAAEAVLPWRLILSSKLEGNALVAETLNMQGVEYTIQGEDNMTVAIARERAREVRTDLATLRRLLAEKEPDAADLVAVYERSSLARYESDGMVVSIPGGAIRIEKNVMERVNGLRVGSQRLTGFAVSVALEPQAELENVLELASVSLENIDLPVETLRLLLEISAASPSLSYELLQALLQTMFTGEAPLVGHIEMQNLKVAEKIFPVSIRSFRLDWPSSAPLRYTSTLDGLTVPSDAIVREIGLQLPNLPAVEASVRTEEEGDAAGSVSLHEIYSVKDLFNFDVRAKFIIFDGDGTPVPPMPMWKYNRLEDAAIAGFDLKLEDKNLMAYVLLNAEGPQATGDTLLTLLQLRPGVDRGGHKKMMDNLAMFIKQPGTLSVSFAPESPVPVPRFLRMLRDPSAFLTIRGTPGATSVRDMIKRIQAARP